MDEETLSEMVYERRMADGKERWELTLH
jgi:hypothetical protein